MAANKPKTGTKRERGKKEERKKKRINRRGKNALGACVRNAGRVHLEEGPVDVGEVEAAARPGRVDAVIDLGAVAGVRSVHRARGAAERKGAIDLHVVLPTVHGVVLYIAKLVDCVFFFLLPSYPCLLLLLSSRVRLLKKRGRTLTTPAWFRFVAQHSV